MSSCEYFLPSYIPKLLLHFLLTFIYFWLLLAVALFSGGDQQIMMSDFLAVSDDLVHVVISFLIRRRNTLD